MPTTSSAKSRQNGRMAHPPRRLATANSPVAAQYTSSNALCSRVRHQRPQRQLRGRQDALLAPLMAIHYAHLVMLTERHIVSHEDARTLRQALDGISLDAVREVPFDGACEDLFFYLERLIAKGRRRAGGRPPAHRPQPQRHRHDDVSDAAARVHQRRWRAPRWTCGARCWTWRRSTPAPSTARTRTPSPRKRPPSRTTCWRSSSSSSATPSASSRRIARPT